MNQPASLRFVLAVLLPALLLLLFPIGSSAQHVHKCSDGRSVSYQSLPCAQGQRTVRQWEAAPEPPPSAEQITRQRDAQLQGEQESAYLRGLAKRKGSTTGRRSSPMGVSISAARDGRGCSRAKQRRDDAERRIGLKRTYESMQRLSRMVYEACR